MIPIVWNQNTKKAFSQTQPKSSQTLDSHPLNFLAFVVNLYWSSFFFFFYFHNSTVSLIIKEDCDIQLQIFFW